MKHARQLRLGTCLMRLFTTCITFSGIQSFAQTFDAGISTNLVSSTNYNDTVYVGFTHPDNNVSIVSNATISANQVIVGHLSTNNVLSVVGDSRLIAGTASTNGMTTGGVLVGDGDGEAALVVNHASKLNTEYLYVGDTNHSGAVELSGKDAEINVAQDTSVGSTGSANSIDIGEGAALTIGRNLLIGSNTGSNNLVTVASQGSLYINSTNNIVVTNAEQGNGVSVTGNGTLQVGGDVNTGMLGDQGVDLKADANLEVGGALTLKNNRINNSLNIILNDSLSTNTASWTSSSLIVGSTTSGNSLTFTNGATGLAQDAVQLGSQSSSKNNALNVGGSNSVFTTEKDVFIGANGAGNSVHVGNGGQMDVGGNLYLGYAASSTGNSIGINSNAMLTVDGDVVVGLGGKGNTFTQSGGQVGITNDFILGSGSIGNRYYQTGGTNTVHGGFIIGKAKSATGGSLSFPVGKDPSTTGNMAIVRENGFFKIQKDLVVGLEGGGSILTLQDGAAVHVTGNAIIGEASGNNVIYLQSGTNTRFNVEGDFVVGKHEDGSNRFAIYGGTANIGGDLLLGATTNQHDSANENFIHLETSNAVLNVANTMSIGASNSVNTVDIVKGAKANANNLLVGAYAGVSNNVVTVKGADSLLHVTNTVAIGNSAGSGNKIVLQNGGTLYAEQNNIEIAGTNNLLQVADGGILKTLGWDFEAQTGDLTNIVFEAGSTLHLLGVLDGTNMIEGGIGFVLDGTNSTWDTGTNAIYIGENSDNNSLTITNGAVAMTDNNLYIGTNSRNNDVIVGGAGSQLTVAGDLAIGSEENTVSATQTGPFTFKYNLVPNTLSVLDGAMVAVGNDAFLYNGATLTIDSKSQMTVGGDYKQDGFSTLTVGVSSNQVQPNLVVTGNAGFSSSEKKNQISIIEVFDDGIGESNIVNIVQAGSLTVDGAAASSATIRGNIQTNLLLDFTVTVSNGLDYSYIVLDDFIKRTIADAAGLEGQLKDIANEINALETGGDSNAVVMLDILEGLATAEEYKTAFDNYYGEKQSSIPAHNAINLGLQSVAEQLTKRADNTRNRMKTTAEGPRGPHMPEQELQGWITAYGTKGSRDASDGFVGYDADLNGFMIGADLSVAENMLVGIAGGSGNGSLDKDNGSATDTKTTFLSIYGSTGTKEWFADASLIYGDSSIDSRLGSTFDTTADYDAQNIAIYVGGGKEMIGEYLILTPQVSLLGNFYKQDAYEEKSTTAVARKVDSFDTFYLQSSVGSSLAFYSAIGNIVLKPEIRAHWLHEWNAREEDLSFSLVGGTGQYNMQLQAPEQDILKIGIGSSAKLGEYLELRADLDTRFGADYSDYTLLGSLRYQF